MSDESVTIVIPAPNGAATLHRCVASVLSQTRKPDRIVVVDNGSTDRTWQMILDLAKAPHEPVVPLVEAQLDGVKFTGLRRPPSNLANARNIASQFAYQDTTVFGFLDVRDWYASRKIERSLEVFAAHPAAVCVVSDDDVYGPDDKVYREYRHPFDMTMLLQGPMHDANCLIRRAGFDAMRALWDESLDQQEDYDLFLRLSEIGLIYHVPEVLHHRSERSGEDTEAAMRFREIVVQKTAHRRKAGHV